MVPFDLRQAFLEPLAVELSGKDLGDGLVHRVAHEVARAITWDAERTGATGFTSYIAAAAWQFSLPLLNARRRRVRNRLFHPYQPRVRAGALFVARFARRGLAVLVRRAATRPAVGLGHATPPATRIL